MAAIWFAAAGTYRRRTIIDRRFATQPMSDHPDRNALSLSALHAT
ncbi:hypothetical protein [Paraburkholderia sp. BL21I4N1]|nr:hypothetical protein [Paraburkholderia sp. BL21I4N1]